MLMASSAFANSTTKESAKTKTRTTAPANDGKSRRPEFKPIIRKLHTIYPAMGKRSIVDHTATYEEKFYLDHHRNTRHELFGLIEKYVSAYVDICTILQYNSIVPIDIVDPISHITDSDVCTQFMLHVKLICVHRIGYYCLRL